MVPLSEHGNERRCNADGRAACCFEKSLKIGQVYRGILWGTSALRLVYNATPLHCVLSVVCPAINPQGRRAALLQELGQVSAGGAR